MAIENTFNGLLSNIDNDEKILLQNNHLGFEGEKTLCILTFIPTSNSSFWMWSHLDCEIYMQDYSKKPFHVSIIDHSLILAMPKFKFEEYKFKAKEMEPSDKFRDVWDGYDKKEQERKQLTNIYFMQSVIGGPVKIGRSDYPESRMEVLQIGCPFKLKIVKEIRNVTKSTERKLHKQFSSYRLHGEWFSEEILKEEII